MYRNNFSIFTPHYNTISGKRTYVGPILAYFPRSYNFGSRTQQITACVIHTTHPRLGTRVLAVKAVKSIGLNFLRKRTQIIRYFMQIIIRNNAVTYISSLSVFRRISKAIHCLEWRSWNRTKDVSYNITHLYTSDVLLASLKLEAGSTQS